MTTAASHYEVLGVPRDATPDQIKAAFHQAALRLHPDKQTATSSQTPPGGADTATITGTSRLAYSFLDVQRAYQVLRNPHMRQVHDRELQLLDLRQHMTFQDELHLTDMLEEHDGRSEGFAYPCRCGGSYWLPQEDVAAALHQVVVPCISCSSHILVDVTGVEVPLPEQQEQGTERTADPG